MENRYFARFKSRVEPVVLIGMCPEPIGGSRAFRKQQSLGEYVLSVAQVHVKSDLLLPEHRRQSVNQKRRQEREHIKTLSNKSNARG